MCSLTKYLKRTSTGSNALRSCYLKPMIDDSRAQIKLHPGINIIGRSPETGIMDIKCSKQQLELNFNGVEGTLNLRILGVNPSGVNGLMALTDAQCTLRHGDVLEMVYGRHPYEVIFASSLEDCGQKESEDGHHQNHSSGRKKCWHSHKDGKLWFYNSTGDEIQSSERIAGYDLDGTLIRTKSGNVFPRDSDDWQINFDCIPKRLQELSKHGFKICIFTNQAGISKGKVSLESFWRKIETIAWKLSVPLQVFVATGDGYQRKPLPGMWEFLEQEANNGVCIDRGHSFFVGDAAGRDVNNTIGVKRRRKDHSLVDRLFAMNLGVKFQTPEEHFLNWKTENWIRPTFSPEKFLNNESNQSLLDPETTRLPLDQCEMIIMVGLPGSGKSHFSLEHLKPLGYKILNADTMNGVNACLLACEKNLSKDVSCVIDNTNVDIESRRKFINLAKKYSITCRCFIMNISEEHIRHNLIYRHLIDHKHSKINEMILNSIKKRYVKPSLEEGFQEIVHVNFKAKFMNKQLENLYKLYLLEK